jgi:hypothetical protein
MILPMKGLHDIEPEILAAAEYLDDALFVEYWGASCAIEKRICEWLNRADSFAKDWRPSDELFLTRSK